jgi:protein arginine kinase
MLSKAVGKWLDATGPSSDAVISSRIRLARNLRGFLFPGRGGIAEAEQVVERTRTVLQKLSIYQAERFRTGSELTPLETQYLVERHLISPDFVRPAQARAVFVSEEESLSIMVNEEDHLRLQMLTSGFELGATLTELQNLDVAMGAELGYAFSDQLGFLTTCPTNVGTGMRASVMIHLPGLALTREVEKILRGALQVGLAVRGLFGEGTETRGNLFQISNQVSLGKSEEEIVGELGKITRDVIGFEHRARDYLFEKLRTEIEDKVFRAEAILNSARLLSTAEATNLLGLLRLGVATGLLSKPSLRAINELLVLSRPANLQVYYDEEMTPPDRDARRAELVRARLRDAAA